MCNLAPLFHANDIVASPQSVGEAYWLERSGPLVRWYIGKYRALEVWRAVQLLEGHIASYITVWSYGTQTTEPTEHHGISAVGHGMLVSVVHHGNRASGSAARAQGQ